MIDVLVVSHSCLTAINRRPWRHMMARGWRVEIVTAKELNTADLVRPADPPEPGDPPLHFLPVGGPNLRLWRFAGFRDVVAARRPRIVMVDYDPGTLITLEAGLTTAGRGTRVVSLALDNIRRSVVQEFRRSPAAGARAAMTLAMSRVASRFVDHVFVLSADSADVMRHFGFGDRTSRIPLGFEPALFHPDEAARSRVRAALGLHETTFAYFGRLIPEKGVHLLLEALQRLRDRPWQLLLDRFSDYRHPYVQQVADTVQRLGLQQRIVYFDAPHERMGDFMNAADIVVMPSRTTDRFKEQYGRVAAEAMACGRTVVVSSSGALPELVGDAGLVVPESQLGALDVPLRELLDNPARRAELGARAAARASGELSMPVQVAKMHDLFSRWAMPPGAPHGSSDTVAASLS